MVAEALPPALLVRGLAEQVRKPPSYIGPEVGPTAALSTILYSHRNAWANSHILGQPNTFLAAVDLAPPPARAAARRRAPLPADVRL
jgi:hypothetical protein